MLGFDTKALLLMPEYEIYFNRGDNYKALLRVGIKNILDYLDTIGIEAHGLFTDDVIHEMNVDSRVTLYNILSMPDTFFVYRNCVGMQNINTAVKWDRTDIIEKYSKNIDAETELSNEDRFNLIYKREKKISQPFIKSYKIVFVVNFKGHNNYKVTSDPNDGNIRVYIDGVTLTPTTYISGNNVNPCDLLNVDYASLPVTQWHPKG